MDAAEATAIRERLVARIPSGWFKSLDIGDGWLPIVDQLDRDIARIRPNYEIHQVKEKFGGLRYYCEADGDDAIRKLIHQAELVSESTCEICGTGEDVTIASDVGSHWIRTLCGKDRAERQRKLTARSVSDLTN